MNLFLRRFLPVLLLLFMLLLPVGCGAQADIEDYAEKTILIHGLTEEDFTITVADLMALEAVSEKAEASRFDGEKVFLTAVGPTLDTFLAAYHCKQSDFATIRFTAKDQYAIAVPENILKSRTILLAYANGKKPLIKEDQPLRVVIPGERAMYWVRMLERIDFEKESGPALAKTLVFLETAVNLLPQEDYKDGEENAKAVKTADLTSTFAGAAKPENVFLLASDGLEKNEMAENFLSAYIKITGKDAPKFVAPHFPQGMHIHGILSFLYGETAFYALGQAASLTKDAKVLPFTDILKSIKLADGSSYIFTDAKGKKVQLPAEKVLNGSFYLLEDGWAFGYGDSGQERIHAVHTMDAVK